MCLLLFCMFCQTCCGWRRKYWLRKTKTKAHSFPEHRKETCTALRLLSRKFFIAMDLSICAKITRQLLKVLIKCCILYIVGCYIFTIEIQILTFSITKKIHFGRNAADVMDTFDFGDFPKFRPSNVTCSTSFQLNFIEMTDRSKDSPLNRRKKLKKIDCWQTAIPGCAWR